MNWKVLCCLAIITLAMSFIPVTAQLPTRWGCRLRLICTTLGDMVFKEEFYPYGLPVSWPSWYDKLPPTFNYTITYGNTTLNMVAYKTGYIIYEDWLVYSFIKCTCVDVYYGKPLNMRFPDINRDGKIDIYDIVIVLDHYGETLLTKP